MNEILQEEVKNARLVLALERFMSQPFQLQDSGLLRSSGAATTPSPARYTFSLADEPEQSTQLASFSVSPRPGHLPKAKSIFLKWFLVHLQNNLVLKCE